MDGLSGIKPKKVGRSPSFSGIPFPIKMAVHLLTKVSQLLSKLVKVVFAEDHPAGIVHSSFRIHVSHTNGGLNPPLRPSNRQGSNDSQAREGGSFHHTNENPYCQYGSEWHWIHLSHWQWRLVCVTGANLLFLVWVELDPLYDGLSGGLNPSIPRLAVRHESKNWIIPPVDDG